MAGVKKPKACESPFPKPEVKTCPIGGCGEPIGEKHWACILHWERFPVKFRFHGNLFRHLWAGDPAYDDFVVRANALNDEIERDIDALDNPPTEPAA